ncbi:hypothetical protein [Sulfurimonas sp.]|uniref:hypothetical protein n=1 Tax=Sulfurimonas sp. TaxID=2022749 RepID=UPI003D114FAB
MKYLSIFIGLLLVAGLSMSDKAMETLSDLAGLLFFLFTVLSMICISTIIAMEIAKNIQLQILDEELDLLTNEMDSLKSHNTFSIEFTKEASDLQQSLNTIDSKIYSLKESNHETV